MNAMLSDEDLTRLMEEAAGSFAVPEPGLQAPAPPRKGLWERRWPKAVAAAAVLVTGTLLVSTTNVGSPHLSGTASDRSADKAPSGAGGGSLGGGTTGGTGAEVAAPPQALTDLTSRRVAAGQAYDKAAGSAGSAAVGGQDDARIVRTGTISLVVREGNVSAAVQVLLQKVAARHGYVADSTSDEAGEHPSASVTVRVPVKEFPALVGDVRGMPVEVVSATQSGEDVTADYADTRAQIQSLTAARSRYLDILSRARTIAETLSVQQRVDDVQQQIDRLEGQRRVLANQSDFGTLTISVAEKGALSALAAEPRTGWSKAWYDAHHRFTHGLQRLLAATGPALLVLLVAAALLLLGRSGWRLARRRLV